MKHSNTSKIKLDQDRHSFRARSPSPQPRNQSNRVVFNKSESKKPKKSRSKSIDARRKDENRLVEHHVEIDVKSVSSRVWARTSSAPSSTCCEEELKVWNTFRKRLASNSTDVNNGQ